MTNNFTKQDIHIIENYDLSLIMSFYHRYNEFKIVLSRNSKYLERNGIEVIIVMDEPSEEKLVKDLLEKYPFISWKLIVNDNPHLSRNHAPVLNVGLKHATRKYVMQIDPEVEYLTDAIGLMRQAIENYPNHYIIGTMAYIPYDTEVSTKDIDDFDFMPWGNIMVERKYLERIRGYDETFHSWGGEDNNVRARLDMIGIKPILILEAMTLHRERNYNPQERKNKVANHTNDDWIRMCYPSKPEANKDRWGEEFSRLSYDWKETSNRAKQFYSYIEKYPSYWLKTEDVFRKPIKKLLLCQAYNEEKFIVDFLEHMSDYFDGIILLDDYSNDNTWDIANHDKLIIKVKKNRTGFYDIENRNILLDLASFIPTEWICFMDIDERFVKGLDNIDDYINNPEVNSITFNAVYLWNDKKHYKGDVPYSKDGVLYVARMFKPQLRRSQIHSNKKLHFRVVPYEVSSNKSSILFTDIGSLTNEQREIKYKRYIKEDIQGDLPGGYEHMKTYNNLRPLEELCLTLKDKKEESGKKKRQKQ